MSFPQAPFQSNVLSLTGKAQQVWVSWFSRIQVILNAITSSGDTAGRPTQNLYVGQNYFDTTLGKPIFWNGSAWVDATGATV